MGSEWAGPGRALQFHIDLHDQVSRGYEWAVTHKGGKVHLSSLPPVVRQRCLLSSTLGYGAGQFRQPVGPLKAFSEVNIQFAMAAMNTEMQALNNAETHYVSHNVMQAVSVAAKKNEPQVLLPTDLPAPSGLVVFETPLFMRDPAPPYPQQAIRAVAWQTTYVSQVQPDGSELDLPGMSYFIFDTIDSREAFREQFAEDPYESMADDTSDLVAWLTDTSGWTFGSPWHDAGDEPDRHAPGEVSTSVAEFRLWLQSYFAWTWQKILVTEPYQPSRAELRRLARSKASDLMDGYIKVLKLRRIDRPYQRSNDDGEEMFYDHSWMVRGHWRQVYYASLGPARNEDGTMNPASHRRKWIDPYIKGDGPLVLGHNVSSAVR